MNTRSSEVLALPSSVRAAADVILGYLAETDAAPVQPVDAIIGFGMFDRSLPRFCADLYLQGLTPKIIFTGGIGAGTGDLGGPEADVWRDELRQAYPTIGDDAFILENRSTNTAENIRFTAERVARTHPDLTFGLGLRRAIVVASPSRLRRVRLTLWKLAPGVHVTRLLPRVNLDAEASLYARQGIDYLGHLIGELDRLATYPDRGWIVGEPLPASIETAGKILRTAARR